MMMMMMMMMLSFSAVDQNVLVKLNIPCFCSRLGYWDPMPYINMCNFFYWTMWILLLHLLIKINISELFY